MNSAQKKDATAIFGKIKLSNSIDYVGAWYHKAAKLIMGTKIKAAFVSTNSITQGEQVTPLWKKILDEYGIQIIFGRRTFKWDSESFQKAAIHCVVIGIADKSLEIDKKIFDGDKIIPATNINPYLVDAPTIFIESRAKHIQKDFVPRLISGSRPTDDGNLLLTADERENILKLEPALAKFIKPCFSGKDFLYNKPRYCFWLEKATPRDIRGSKELYRRVEAVKSFRLASKSSATQKFADTPHLFLANRQPTTDYLFIPQVSSENRRYIPIGFISAENVCLDPNFMIPNAKTYDFGILTSSIHMAWMRAVSGRLKSDYRYSGSVVYNNFAWCEADLETKLAIEATAAEILMIRAKYQGNSEVVGREVGKNADSLLPYCSTALPQGSTLADLYDELTMPAELRLAHRKNDLAVAKAYGFEEILDNEPEIVAALMKMNETLTKP